MECCRVSVWTSEPDWKWNQSLWEAVSHPVGGVYLEHLFLKCFDDVWINTCHINVNPLSVLSLWMKKCSFSVPSDYGRTRWEWPRPCSRLTPSILRGHQDGHSSLHSSVHQNVPEQNLPRVPGQEETQEKRQELIRAQCDSVEGAETPSKARG